jgi:hypothetical protein
MTLQTLFKTVKKEENHKDKNKTFRQKIIRLDLHRQIMKIIEK